jgi:hypothetical protein
MKESESAIEPKNHKLTLQFAYGGRDYRLIKRKQITNAPWYLRKWFRGKAYWRSTNTNDAELAIHKAKAIINAILHSDFCFLTEIRLRDPDKRAPTLSQVFDIYRRHAPVDPSIAVSNITALCSMVRVVFGETKDPLTLSVCCLTPAFVRSFQAKHVEHVNAEQIASAGEKLALLRAQRTVNNLWHQARSLFIASMMCAYRDAGLVIPADFDELAKTPMISGVMKGRGPGRSRARYINPTDQLIRATIAEPAPAELRMYTVKQAAELFSMSVSWIRERITAGDLDGYLCGNMLISGASINRYLSCRSVKSPSSSTHPTPPTP